MKFTEPHSAAFPRPIGESGQHEATNTEQDGMTIREWFDGQALAGLLAATRFGGEVYGTSTLARAAFDLADAMLAKSRRLCDEQAAKYAAERKARAERGLAEDEFDGEEP